MWGVTDEPRECKDQTAKDINTLIISGAAKLQESWGRLSTR